MQAVGELHRLWQSYIDDLCLTSDNFNSIVKGMILHGCRLRVVEARNPTHVNLEGIVIEISSAFLHIASGRQEYDKGGDSHLEAHARMSHVPKKGSVFTCILPGNREDRLVTIVGDHLKV